MASNDEDLCTSHADFAVICSFVEKFGEKLGLTLPNIGELQSSLEDTDNGDGISPTNNQADVRPEIYLLPARFKGFHHLNGRENIGDTKLKQIMVRKHCTHCQTSVLEYLMC
ncbi:hypothetical protein E2C01_080635 [Portunus trituberculatus]|uniref:Uncharacterized protein n=1 Tax=Portunus trituberculatus TaxID=210409 RepID=A0A5B7IWM8_PORTR|nr:hypothetical protein [Portunus trituberculatus]